MSTKVLREIRAAVRHLNPNVVRELAEKPLAIGLVASSTDHYAAMEEYFVPPGVSRQKRKELLGLLHRVGDPGSLAHCNITVCEEGLPAGPGAVTFYFGDPERTIREILRRHRDLSVALARHFPPFRAHVMNK